jgi:tripartite-type tricarboxylate transporter receptor subunit TctC
MKKKALSCLCVFLSVVLLVGCSKAPAPQSGDQTEGGTEGEWKFERPIEIVCPWGVGGGADSTIRPMADLLTDILGVQVNVVNVEGAGGAAGVEYTYQQPADGYTFMLGTQSLILVDLQDIMSMDFRDEFIPVAKLVHSINIIAASAKASAGKYSTFSEMIEYVKEHPNEVSCGMLSATGADAMGLRQAIRGLAIKEVPFGSGSEMNAALAGGHLHLMITGTDEIAGLIASGDIIPLLALSEKRMKKYPDLECSGELGIDSYIGTWRGIFAKKGTPQGAIDALVAAIEEAVQTDTWQEFLVNAVYDEREGYANPENFKKLFLKEYEELGAYLESQGALKKRY